MAHRDLVVIGASMGGVEALGRLLGDLPEGLRAAVVIVQHVSASGTSVLPRVLQRTSRLPVRAAEDGAGIEAGVVYVAPPDRHVMVELDRLVVSAGPRENGHRPAVDVLFRSAARAHGNRVIGVVLTGALDDGAAGLHAIKARGGTAVVQDPRDAQNPDMPRHAMRATRVDHCVPLAEIPAVLARLVAEEVAAHAEREMDAGSRSVERGQNFVDGMRPSAFACPECGGVLWEQDEAGLLRFRCRIGHGHTPATLEAAERETTEAALWAAVRALDETASLLDRMANRATASGQARSMERFRARAEEAAAHATVLRSLLLRGASTGEEEP